jgi:hypothetical protein
MYKHVELYTGIKNSALTNGPTCISKSIAAEVLLCTLRGIATESKHIKLKQMPSMQLQSTAQLRGTMINASCLLEYLTTGNFC